MPSHATLTPSNTSSCQLMPYQLMPAHARQHQLMPAHAMPAHAMPAQCGFQQPVQLPNDSTSGKLFVACMGLCGQLSCVVVVVVCCICVVVDRAIQGCCSSSCFSGCSSSVTVVSTHLAHYGKSHQPRLAFSNHCCCCCC
jgi:hypothetical protein